MKTWKLACLGLALMLVATAGARADDLSGVDIFMCASVQATMCLEGGDCTVDLPWNLNVPEFIVFDLQARKLSTTLASGENRATPITQLIRENGTVVVQGFEKGRAFSFVVTEQTGRLSAAVAIEGASVAVFGACTPWHAPAVPAAK